jgi:hypothetical protein
MAATFLVFSGCIVEIFGENIFSRVLVKKKEYTFFPHAPTTGTHQKEKDEFHQKTIPQEVHMPVKIQNWSVNKSLFFLKNNLILMLPHQEHPKTPVNKGFITPGTHE